MTEQNFNTLVNPQTGNLAFKIFSFYDNSHFDQLQRLNYFIKQRQGLQWLRRQIAYWPPNCRLYAKALMPRFLQADTRRIPNFGRGFITKSVGTAYQYRVHID